MKKIKVKDAEFNSYITDSNFITIWQIKRASEVLPASQYIDDGKVLQCYCDFTCWYKHFYKDKWKLEQRHRVGDIVIDYCDSEFYLVGSKKQADLLIRNIETELTK